MKRRASPHADDPRKETRVVDHTEPRDTLTVLGVSLEIDEFGPVHRGLCSTEVQISVGNY